MGSQHKSGWVRGVRPSFWWLILVLVLYGIRWNQQQVEQTRLYFTISLNGQPLVYPVYVTWDGRPINNGDEIALGGHLFKISGPKTEPYTTNISVWYGKHDLGEIRLARSFGTLSIKADPPPRTITISGSEYSTTLDNWTATNLTVPTDDYAVNFQYNQWSDSRSVTVKADSTSSVAFSPDIGMLNMTCNRDGATFQIQNESGQVESGDLPDSASLPPGKYQVWAQYHRRTIQKTADVQKGAIGELQFQFFLGAVQFETHPVGAEVHAANGEYLGRTPLLLPDITPQEAQYNLSLSGYQPVSVTLDATADQTNYYSTNLVNIGYENAIGEARTYLDASNFEAAVQAVTAALNAKPNDADALALQKEASGFLEAQQQRVARLQKPGKWFDNLCSQYSEAPLFSEHELDTSKSASDVAMAIYQAMTNGLANFKILRTTSPDTGIYEIVAQQTFSLGILGGNERDCLIIVGQATDDQTQIHFKIMDFQIQHSIVNFQDQKRLVPISPRTIQMNGFLEGQLREGLKDVTGRIQKATE